MGRLALYHACQSAIRSMIPDERLRTSLLAAEYIAGTVQRFERFGSARLKGNAGHCQKAGASGIRYRLIRPPIPSRMDQKRSNPITFLGNLGWSQAMPMSDLH